MSLSLSMDDKIDRRKSGKDDYLRELIITKYSEPCNVISQIDSKIIVRRVFERNESVLLAKQSKK